MTKNEFNALKYINQHTRTEGYPPSYQEIADYLLIKSRANIHRIVESLMKQEFIVKKIGSVRACFLTKVGKEFVKIQE